MHILIAPNAFKNSLAADEVADAIGEGLLQSRLECTVGYCPVGDGGDGTGNLLAGYLNAQAVRCETTDALGRPLTAPLYITADGKTAIIELADASGLKQLRPEEYRPLQADTKGTGALIKAAFNQQVSEIILCIGGSATVDGGAGLLHELGVVFKNAEDGVITCFPGELELLERVDLNSIDKRVHTTRIVVVCDVENKLLGKEGAAAVFGPQKGASDSDVQLLEKCLQRLNEVVYRTTGVHMEALPYSGAAGGVAASLSAICGATAVNGTRYFLEAVGFKEKLRAAQLVITGEGCIDGQTLQGKAPFGVALAAKEAGVPVIGVAGDIRDEDASLYLYFDELMNINPPGLSLADALRSTRKNLAEAGRQIGENIAGSRWRMTRS